MMPRVFTLIGLSLAFWIAILGGYWLTVSSLPVAQAIEREQIGSWWVWPRSGSLAADPYLKANIAAQSILPIGLGEGIALVATVDETGEALEGRCSYNLAGRLPAARFFSIGIYKPDGTLVDTPTGRHAFTGSELLRTETGDWSIIIQPEAAPGNWLPSGPDGPVLLVLRLYDTPLSASAAGLAASGLPALVKVSCP
jgi:hypothetical protein